MKPHPNSTFYIYLLLDPRYPGPCKYLGHTFSHQPFYVGKGCRLRNKDLVTRGDRVKCHLSKLYELNLLPISVTVEHFPTEEQAYKSEVLWISAIGRRDLGTGPLVNLTSGGDGAFRMSPESIQKMRDSHRGKKFSPEHIRQMRITKHLRDKYYKSDHAKYQRLKALILDYRFRKRLSEKQRLAKLRDRKHTPEAKRKISATKHRNRAIREAMAQSLSGVPHVTP